MFQPEVEKNTWDRPEDPTSWIIFQHLHEKPIDFHIDVPAP
jgi:hypothetical protein